MSGFQNGFKAADLPVAQNQANRHTGDQRITKMVVMAAGMDVNAAVEIDRIVKMAMPGNVEVVVPMMTIMVADINHPRLRRRSRVVPNHVVVAIVLVAVALPARAMLVAVAVIVAVMVVVTGTMTRTVT